MKSYTDLKQSEKLAKFLPLETADQTWERIAIAGANLDVPKELQYRHNGDTPYQYYSGGIGIPCWSLAALMEILPNNKDITTTLGRGVYDLSNKKPEYKNKWAVEYEDEGNLDTGKYVNYTTTADTAIDACVEMILKLKEKSLL